MLTEKTWRPDAVILFCGLQLMCLCFGAMVVGLMDKWGVAAFKMPDGFGAVVVGTLSFQGATWGLIGVLLWQHQWNWQEFFGLRGPKLSLVLVWSVFTAAVLLFVTWSLKAACVWLLTRFGWPPAEETAVHLVETLTSPGGKVYMGVFAVVMAPVAEEFIFRGLLFSFIKQLGFPRVAWVGVSALFALIHWDAATFVPLFVLALALTWLYDKTGNLLAPITAHALFNAVNLVVLLGGGQTTTP